MNLEIIRDEEAFLALEAHWDRLLEQSATPTPFLRWDWVSLWWREHRESCRLAMAVVRDEAGVPEGIAPFVIGSEQVGPRRHLRQLGFINGIGPIQGERLDLLVRQGREPLVTPLLIRAFRECEQDWDVMRLNKVPEESANYPLLRRAMADCGSNPGVLNRTECVYLDLPRNWQELEKSRDSDWRRKQRKRWQVLTEEQGAQPFLAGRDLPIEDAFEDLIRLHAMKWPEGVSSFLRPGSLRIHRELARRWGPKGRITVPGIQHRGHVIAAIYGIACGKEMLQYQIGWHADYARLGLGNLAMRWSIEAAMAEGCARYDFLPGDYAYKHSWSRQSRYLADLECFHHERPRAVLFQLLRAVKRRVSRAAASAALLT